MIYSKTGVLSSICRQILNFYTSAKRLPWTYFLIICNKSLYIIVIHIHNPFFFFRIIMNNSKKITRNRNVRQLEHHMLDIQGATIKLYVWRNIRRTIIGHVYPCRTIDSYGLEYLFNISCIKLAYYDEIIFQNWEED